jgi:hypothetical protein
MFAPPRAAGRVTARGFERNRIFHQLTLGLYFVYEQRAHLF